jgi:F-type H+-transporting ATPase subunit b
MKHVRHLGKRRSLKVNTAAVLLAALLLFCFAGVAAAATEGEHGSEHGAPAKGWVATDTYKLMNFAVLAIALFLLLRKPVSKALGDRIQGIKDQLSDLEAKKKAAEAELARYSEKFQKLEQEAENLIAQYIQQGEEAKARIIQEAEKAAEKLQDQARRNIESEFEKAKKNLRENVLEEALAEAETLIKSRISSDDQERLVDEYIDKVVA